MNDTPRRDDVVERLLRRVSTSSSGTGVETCPDAEILAAWTDDELAGAQRELVDRHVAGCERCQMIAATMARSAPSDEVAAAASSGRWLRWLVPVGAAAAVLAFWMLAPGRFPANRVPAAGQQADLGQAAAPEPAGSSARNAASTGAEATPGTPPVEDKKLSQGQVAEARPQPAPAPARPSNPTSPPAAAAPPPPPPQAQASASAEALGKAAPAMREVAENRPRAADALSVGLEFRTPDGSVRWRLRSGMPERSADAGATWMSLPTGVDATLLAGSAPDADTCWLVGRSGVILRRLGDGPWFRVDFPEAVDLTSVRATDADHAAVTTTDGRVFDTTDGGQTWVRRSLQGIPPATF